MLKLLLWLLTFSFAADAMAQTVRLDRRERRILADKIAAGTTLAAPRSFTVSVGDIREGAYGLALIYVSITDANDSETGVSLDCTASEDENVTSYRIPACVWDNTNLRYNCEAGPLFWNPSDETSPKRQVFRVDFEGMVAFKCTFTFTGGAAADSIHVPRVVLSTKG